MLLSGLIRSLYARQNGSKGSILEDERTSHKFLGCGRGKKTKRRGFGTLHGQIPDVDIKSQTSILYAFFDVLSRHNLGDLPLYSRRSSRSHQSFLKCKATRNFLRRFQTEQNDFLGRIITGDETWVYSWDPETKRQSAEWRDFDEPRPEKVRRKQGALKVMHMIFFDMNGVILRWPVPISTTINAQYYKKVLQDKLRPAI
ncbi:hypothetical protein RRG08_051704 [Elysia crispata]|uniref:Transposase n=1 Tax=Elysia crispata TaxID=231223 RepID=A0AAE1ECV9_9GAST|nr:hypothetical protein RRG08_051704 [Elysia crispata]